MYGMNKIDLEKYKKEFPDIGYKFYSLYYIEKVNSYMYWVGFNSIGIVSQIAYGTTYMIKREIRYINDLKEMVRILEAILINEKK